MQHLQGLVLIHDLSVRVGYIVWISHQCIILLYSGISQN